MRLLLFIGLLNCVLALSAQQEAGTFLMNDELYQASHLNPAFMPEKDVYSVSSMYFNFTHNGFALKHLLTPKEDGGGVRDDSLIVNIPNAIYNMKDKNNFLSVNFNYDIFGIKLKKWGYYFGLSLHERLSMVINYPKDFMDVMLGGNGDYIGKRADLGLNLKALHYRELAMSFMSHQELNEVETASFGARVKCLFGIGTAQTTTSNAYLTTADSFLYLKAEAEYLIDISGMNTIQSDPGAYALNMKNFGLGMDLGFDYYNSYLRMSVSGSLLDIGFIGWRTDVSNYYTNGEFEFEGLDLTEYLKGDSVEFESTAQEIVDTLQERFSLQETNNTFRTGLLPRHYLSVAYKIRDKSKVSFLLYGDFYKGYRPNFTVGFNQIAGKFMHVGVHYSIKNRSFNNLGGSLAIKTGPVQMFFMTDNFMGILLPYSLKTVNFRFGLNVLFTTEKRRIEPKFKQSMEW